MPLAVMARATAKTKSRTAGRIVHLEPSYTPGLWQYMLVRTSVYRLVCFYSMYRYVHMINFCMKVHRGASPCKLCNLSKLFLTPKNDFT